MANILIVDSYDPVNLLYCEVLGEYGHHVFSARSGRDALQVALDETINIAVVDDKLPDLPAEEVFIRLKQLQPQIQGILSVSSIFSDPLNRVRWDGLIAKSCDYTLLRTEVDKLAGVDHGGESEGRQSGISGFLFPD